MTGVSLARHLALSKNVRGLSVYDPDAPPEQPFFTWVSRKHQYRSVGFPSALWNHPTVDLAEYETIERLDPPVAGLRKLVTGAAVDAPAGALESLLVASAYVVPLFIHREAVQAFEPFARWRLEADALLPEDQILQHVRILGYGMLDSFASSTGRAWDALEAGGVAGGIDHRDEVAAADGTDRCWRLLEDEYAGDTWVGGYFDVLPAIGPDASSR